MATAKEKLKQDKDGKANGRLKGKMPRRSVKKPTVPQLKKRRGE